MIKYRFACNIDQPCLINVFEEEKDFINLLIIHTSLFVINIIMKKTEKI